MIIFHFSLFFSLRKALCRSRHTELMKATLWIIRIIKKIADPLAIENGFAYSGLYEIWLSLYVQGVGKA